MKLIYKLTIIINDNLKWDYIFDNYTVIEKFLINYKSEFEHFKIDTLIKCSECYEFERADFCFFLKLLDNITPYCCKCADGYLIDIDKFRKTKYDD